jgi:hypothetical protein
VSQPPKSTRSLLGLADIGGHNEDSSTILRAPFGRQDRGLLAHAAPGPGPQDGPVFEIGVQEFYSLS